VADGVLGPADELRAVLRRAQRDGPDDAHPPPAHAGQALAEPPQAVHAALDRGLGEAIVLVQPAGKADHLLHPVDHL